MLCVNTTLVAQTLQAAEPQSRRNSPARGGDLGQEGASWAPMRFRSFFLSFIFQAVIVSPLEPHAWDGNLFPLSSSAGL